MDNEKRARMRERIVEDVRTWPEDVLVEFAVEHQRAWVEGIGDDELQTYYNAQFPPDSEDEDYGGHSE